MSLFLNKKIIVLIDQAIFSGISFFLTLMFARVLSINDFGFFSGYILILYFLISSVNAFVVQPFQVGLSKTSHLKSYYSFVFWFQLSISLLFSLLVFVCCLYFYKPIPISLLFFALGFIFHDFGRKFLMAINLTSVLIWFDLIYALSTTLVFLLSFLNNEIQLFTLILNLSVVYIASFVLFIIFIKPFKFDFILYRTQLYEHFREGQWLFFTSFIQWWSGNLFVVAAGLYLGSAALAALRLVQSAMGVLNIFLQSFENYVLPQTAQKINTSYQFGINYLLKTTKQSGIIFFILLSFIFVFSESIITLIGGESYKNYAFVLQGMAILYVIILMSQPYRIVCRALLLNKHFFYGYVLSFIFSILFSRVLISNFGLTGAIIGLTASQIILIIYWSIILQKRNISLWKSFTLF